MYLFIKMKNKGYYYPYTADIFSQLHWVDVLLTLWTNFWFQHELCCTLAILLLTMSWVSAGQLLSVHWLLFKEYWKIWLLVKYLHVFRWFTSHLLMERVKETRRFRWGDGYAKLFEAVFTFVRKLPCRKSSIVNGRHKTY